MAGPSGRSGGVTSGGDQPIRSRVFPAFVAAQARANTAGGAGRARATPAQFAGCRPPDRATPHLLPVSTKYVI